MAPRAGRKPKPYSQVARITKIVRRLGGSGATVGELADSLGVTKRQIQRDLQYLDESGYPVIQEEGRWSLPRGFKGLEVTVTPNELMSLHLALSHLEYLKGTPFVDDLEEVMAKVVAGVPTKVGNHLERIVTTVAPLQRPVRAYAVQKQIVADLRKALLRQLTIVLSGYRKLDGPPEDYRVDPYGLILYQYGLYLVGHSHQAGELRIFALERITTLTVTDDMFDMPASGVKAKSLDRAFGLIAGPSEEVTIRIAPEWAYFVKERQWHPTQTLTLNDDGSVILRMQCGGLDELTAWVLSFGDGAQVLGPASLVERVSGQLAAAAAWYRRPR